MNPLTALLLASPLIILAWLFWTEFTGAGFQPAPKRAIEQALKLANVSSKDTFYDLGAGNGRVLIAAAKTGARAIGIEIDPLRYLVCRLQLRINKTKGKTTIIFGNIYSIPFNSATVVFIYLRNWSNERLKTKLLAELRPGTRIITYHWPMKGWTPIAKDEKNKIYIYTI